MAQGIQIRLTHTGQSNQFILIDDLGLGDTLRGKPTNPSYIPAPTADTPNPSVLMTFGGQVPLSYETGDIRKFIERGDLTAEFIFSGVVQKGMDSAVVVTSTSGAPSPDTQVLGSDDFFILVDTSNDAVTLTLPEGSTHSRGRVKVVDIGGNANSNNITVTPGSGDTIDGGGPTALTVDSGQLELVYNAAASNWVRIAAASSVVAPHAFAGAQHTADTLANLNTKVSDATLLDAEGTVSRDFASFTPGSGPSHSEGRVFYDDTDKTLSVHVAGNSTLQVGQEDMLRVLNNTGSLIPDGAVVRISGAASGRPTVALAQASDTEAQQTVGLTTGPIGNGQEGFVTERGLVRGLDTSAWSAGDIVWVDASTAGALTNVEPSPPNRGIRIGYVIVSDASDGVVLVERDRGEDLGDLHDVSTGSEVDKAILQYNAGSSLWEPKDVGVTLSGVKRIRAGSVTSFGSISAALSGAISGDVVYVGAGSYSESITIPSGVRVVGFPDARGVVLSGSSASATRVTFQGSGTLREFTIQAPSSGSNPAVDCSSIGSSDLAVVSDVVFLGQNAAGAAVLAGADGTVLLEDSVHNGGTFTDDYVRSTGATVIVSGGFAKGGSVGGSYWNIQGGKIDFTVPWVAQSEVSSATAALRLGAGSVATGSYRLSQPSNISRGLWVDGENVSVELIGCDFRSALNDFYIGSFTGTGSVFHLTGYARQETIVNLGGATWAQNASVLVLYQDTGALDDNTTRVGGELSVGVPVNPAEASIGEGDSTTQGMVAFSDDGTGTSFVDLTDILKTKTDSQTDLLQGTASGQTFYLGNLGRRFPSFKPDITTAMEWGTGTGVWEYSTGPGTWQEFDVLYRDDDANGSQYGTEWGTIASSTKSTKVNLGDLARETNWVTAAVNGVTAYWIRFRLTSAIDVVPEAERIKLSTNSVEIDSTGIQFHGTSRPEKKLMVHQRLTDDLQGASPGNETLSISPNIGITPVDNEFSNGANDGLGGFITIPPGLDTSSPIRFSVGWAPQTNGTGEFKLKLYVASPILVGTNVDSGTVPEQPVTTLWDTQRPSGLLLNSIPTVEAGTDDELYISTAEVNLPDALPGTVFAYALRRNDSSDPDSLSSNVSIVFLEADGTFWRV